MEEVFSKDLNKNVFENVSTFYCYFLCYKNVDKGDWGHLIPYFYFYR